MKKKNLILATIVLSLFISGILGYNVYAGSGFISTGRIEFDNNTTNPGDDVIFDSDDLRTLDGKIIETENKLADLEKEVEEKKKEIVNILETNPNIEIIEGNTITFEEIVTYILGSTDIPEDTYFYEEGTEGDENIVTYKKIEGKYYLCNQHGEVAEGISETDVSDKILHEYKGATSTSKTAGAAAYANGNFYLGNGSDNKEHYGQGGDDKISDMDIYFSTFATSSYSALDNVTVKARLTAPKTGNVTCYYIAFTQVNNGDLTTGKNVEGLNGLITSGSKTPASVDLYVVENQEYSLQITGIPYHSPRAFFMFVYH